MNCAVCPHEREIRNALGPCQRCGGDGDTCRTCPQLKSIEAALKPCAVCDAGRVHGQVSIDAAADQNLVLAHREDIPSGTSSGCSALAPEDENAVRVALCTLFSFEPLEVLLIQHLVNGGTLASFNEPVRALVDRITRKGYNLDDGQTGFRALVCIWRDRIIQKMPTLGAFFDAMKSRNAYTHKRLQPQKVEPPPRRRSRATASADLHLTPPDVQIEEMSEVANAPDEVANRQDSVRGENASHA